jgi:ribonuclease HI
VGWTLASQEGRRPAAVKNQDLWKLFLGVVRQLHGDGVNVSIWRIPREWNERADRFAKEGAGKGEQLDFHVVEPDGPLHLCFTPYQDDAEL